MALELVMAPNPIFKQKAMPVAVFDDALKQEVAQMFDVLYKEQAIGIGANMVGLLKRIVVIDLQENGVSAPLAMINPVLEKVSGETQTIEEASRSYPGISAPITRPSHIVVTFQDEDGTQHTLETDGMLAQVVQHEMDYLDGKTFLDHLSPMKRTMLMKKMKKFILSHIRHHHHHHEHGPDCGC